MRTSVFVVGHKNDRLKKRPLCRGKTTLHVSQLLTSPVSLGQRHHKQIVVPTDKQQQELLENDRPEYPGSTFEIVLSGL